MKEIPSNIKVVLKEAKELLEQGGAESAEQARSKLLDVSEASEYPIYHMMLAKIAKELNQKDAALAHLEKSLEFDKPSIQAILRVSESRIKDGNISEGYDLLMKGKALVLEEGSAKLGCRVGTLLIKAGYPDQAIEMLGQLQKFNPNDRELSYTLGLAYRQKGNTEQYEIEALNGIKNCEVKDTLKQRVQLAKHYMSANSYSKALTLLEPVKGLNDTEYSDEKIREIVTIMSSICLVEANSLDSAKELIVSVKKQSGIGANYVWCKIQFKEGDYTSAAKTASAIKLLSEKLLGKMDSQKKKADDLLNDPASSIKDGQRKRLESALSSEALGLEQIAAASVQATKESLSQFLADVHKVWLNTLPG